MPLTPGYADDGAEPAADAKAKDMSVSKKNHIQVDPVAVEVVAVAMRTYDATAGSVRTWRELATVALVAQAAFEAARRDDTAVRPDVIADATREVRGAKTISAKRD